LAEERALFELEEIRTQHRGDRLGVVIVTEATPTTLSLSRCSLPLDGG
jgi:hypothetical protein